jgi:multiple sugar transport system substrate-binding protein
MKRTLSMLLILLMTAAFCAASPQAEVENKPVTITFYHYATQTHVLYLKPLKEAFQKAYPNISMTSVEVTAGGYEALSQKILLGLAAGDPPDVGQVGYNLLSTMVESGAAVALDAMMAADSAFKKDNLFPAMMSLGQLEGKQYLIPIGTSTPAMLNNLELFASVGLNPNALPKSWDETRQAAQTLKNAGKLGVLWGWSITGNWIFQALLENCGGHMANAAGTQAAFNDAAGVKVLTYLAGLAADGLMPVTDQTIATFIAGNLGMLVDSSFQRVNTPQQCKFTVRLSPMPTPDGSPPLVPAGGNGAMLFSKDAARKAAAWKFMRWMTEQEASRIVAETSGYTPANQTVVRALQTEHANDENFKVTLEQAARVTPWYSWRGPNGNEIAKVLRDMQEAVLLGKKTPKAALDETAARVNALLK